MKLVTAVIRSEKTAPVQTALARLGHCQHTMSEVWGQGHEPGQTYIYRGRKVQDSRIKRIKLEVAVEDHAVEDAVEAIREAAKTGAVGDRVITVSHLEVLVRIRTGQRVGKPLATMDTARPAHTNRLNQPFALPSRG